MVYNLRKNPTSSHKKDYIYDCRKTTIVKSKTKINVKAEFVKTVIAKANESGESTIVETVKIIKANQFRKTRVKILSSRDERNHRVKQNNEDVQRIRLKDYCGF